MDDLLSVVLRAMRLTGGIFLEAHFSEPWCVTSRIRAEDCKPFTDAPAQVIAYYLVIDGRMLLNIDGDESVEVAAGELVLLPRNDRHTLGSAPQLVAVRAESLIEPRADGGIAQVSYGGGGAPTHLVYGFLASEDDFNPLIVSLPRVLKLDFSQAASREWFEATVRFIRHLLAERQLASSIVVSRLSELLFVTAVRSYASSLDDPETGWFRGVNDRYVGHALARIHGDMGKQWTAETLARDAGLSRSTFVERFTSLVGIPPIRYLAYWRLQTAKHLIRETRRNIAQLAYSVGYESEAAFSRAFRRRFGLSPAQWRTSNKAAQADNAQKQ